MQRRWKLPGGDVWPMEGIVLVPRLGLGGDDGREMWAAFGGRDAGRGGSRWKGLLLLLV